MSGEWFTASELVALPGVPNTVQGLNRAAARDNWPSRKREKGKGYEYPLSALPAATRDALGIQAAQAETEKDRAGRAAAAKRKMAADQAKHATLSASSDGLARLATLAGNARDRAEARLAVLDALKAFTARGSRSKTAALNTFVAYYNDGAIDCAQWICDQLGTLSVASVYRWQKTAREDGGARLSGHYGNRKGTGKIDSQPELTDFAHAMVSEHPHVRAKHLQQAIGTQFNDSGLSLPSLSACERWLGRFKKQNPSLYTAIANPDGWKSNYMPAFGSASEDVTRINQRWELDSTPADILLTDGRHSIVGVIDIYTRRAKLVVSKTSTSRAIASVVRRAVLDWGVPESVKHDNGSDYVSHHLTRVWGMLETEQIFCNPYSGWEKPHIERFFRSFSHDLLELLPGYAGHNVAERSAIESQKSFADRLLKKSEIIEIRKSADDLQAFCDDWLASVYERQAHSGLNGRTPLQAAAGQAFAAVKNERGLDVLLAQAPGDGKRVVGKKGISVHGTHYIAPELGDYVGEPVLVLYDEHDIGRIHVLADLGSGYQHLCVAEAPELTGISPKAVAEKARAMRTGNTQRRKREFKRAARQYNTADVAEQIIADRERAASRVTGLPGRPYEYESDGLRAAADAVEASDAADETPSAPPKADPEARQATAQSVERDQQAPETARDRWKRWLGIQKHGLAGPDDRAWLPLYESSDEFFARYDLYYGDQENQHDDD